MSIIETIQTKIRLYPELKYSSSNTSLCIEPASKEGFPVRIDLAGEKFIVSFHGWHESFTDENEALNCFALGLSKQSRLRIISRGSFEDRWILERLKDGEWAECSETGLLVFPFWRRRIERIQQNSILDI